MLITSKWLRKKGACTDGKRYFDERWPDGAEAVDVLTRLQGEPEDSQARREGWDGWLIRNAGQDCPALYGPNGDKVAVLIGNLPNLPYFKPTKEERTKVAALVQQHLKCLNKFGCPQDAPVKFTNDLAAARDAAWAAAWDAARDAAWAAQYLIVEDKLDFGNPWALLMEIWELGYWPVGLTKEGHFLVYEPKIGDDDAKTLS